MGKNLGILEEIVKAQPTDGLWDDGRTDVGQLGMSYQELEEAMKVVDTFGTDARSITRTLENIKDPEQVEKAVETENVEKFDDHSKQLKN